MIALLMDDYHRTIEVIGYGDAKVCKKDVTEYCLDTLGYDTEREIEWQPLKKGGWYAEVGDEGYPVYIREALMEAGRVGEDTVVILRRGSMETP